MASGMSGMGTLQLPILAFVFALLLIGYSIWDLDQLSGPAPAGTTASRSPDGADGPVLVGAMAGPGAAACRAVGGRSAVAARLSMRGSAPASRATGVSRAWVAKLRIAMGVTWRYAADMISGKCWEDCYCKIFFGCFPPVNG